MLDTRSQGSAFSRTLVVHAGEMHKKAKKNLCPSPHIKQPELYVRYRTRKAKREKEKTIPRSPSKILGSSARWAEVGEKMQPPFSLLCLGNTPLPEIPGVRKRCIHSVCVYRIRQKKSSSPNPRKAKALDLVAPLNFESLFGSMKQGGRGRVRVQNSCL